MIRLNGLPSLSAIVVILVLAIGVGVAPADSRADVTSPKPVQLPSPAYALAVSPKARTVAISFAEEGVTRLYPKLLTDASLDGAKEFKGLVPPTCLVHREL